MTILSEETRALAFEMILYADRNYGLKIKGGLQGYGLVSGSKAHKMMGDRARDEFRKIWTAIDWNRRESVITIVPFLIRVMELTPPGPSTQRLEHLLFKDGLRIRKGELRRIVGVIRETPSL